MESKLQLVIPVFLLIYRVDKREVIILSLLFSLYMIVVYRDDRRDVIIVSLLFSLYMIVVAFNTTTLVCLLC